MTARRIVDEIPEYEDKYSAPEHWQLLMEPMYLALSDVDEVDLENVYVDVPSPETYVPYAFFADAKRLELSDGEKATSRNLETLSPVSSSVRPIALIGEPGIGKSTWVRHFFRHSIRRHIAEHSRIKWYIYDHKVQSGSVFGSADPAVRLRATLAYHIVDLLQESLRSFNLFEKLLDIELQSIGQTASLQEPWLEERLRQAVRRLDKERVQLWVVIDNLDRYETTEQREAFSIANYLSRQLAIRTLVPMRPYSYDGHAQHLEGVCVALIPPSINKVLQVRLDYLQHHADRFGLAKLAEQRRRDAFTFPWSGGRIDSEESLMRLYLTVIDLVRGNRALTSMLECIRHHNVRTCLRDIRHLVSSGHFVDCAIDALSTTSRTSGISPHRIVTSYLRGPYHHYRGRTSEYKVGIVNIFDVPGVIEENQLVAMRALQFMRKQTRPDAREGIRSSALCDWLQKLGYPDADIETSLRFLLRERLVKEVSRLVNWRKSQETLLPSDELLLTYSGQFYVSQLLRYYALRYAEAMADVTLLPESHVVARLKSWRARSERARTKTLTDTIDDAREFVWRIERILDKEMQRLSSEPSPAGAGNKLDWLFCELSHDGGLFPEMVEGAWSHVSSLYSSGRITDNRKDVEEKWRALLDKAAALRAAKNACLTRFGLDGRS